MREIIISVIAVILIVFMVLLFSCEAIKDTLDNDSRDKVEMQISEYRGKKRELEQSLNRLVSERDKVIQGVFRLMFLVNVTDEVAVEEIYQTFEENNIVATLCFDKDNIPGKTSQISTELYLSLLEKGWQGALYYDGALAVNEWIEDFNENDIQIPLVVVMDESSFNDSLANELYALGFEDIIVKTVNPNVSREDIEGGARVTDSVGWCTFAASDLIKTYLPQTGDVVFSIGGKTTEEVYEPEQFSRMLTAINEMVEKGRLFYTTPFKAEEYRQKLREDELLTVDEYIKSKEQLEIKINELELLIQEKYEKYISGE